MDLKKIKKLSMGDLIIIIVLTLIALITLYPFLNSLAVSLNDASDTSRGGINLIPRKLTLDNYKVIFRNSTLYSALGITVLRTIIGTATSVFCTAMLAFGLSKANLKGRKFYMTLCLITMYFNGGLIPFYLLIRSLKLIDHFPVYVIPYLISIFNMIIMLSYFRSIPASIEESATIDGAGIFKIFFSIIIPLSKPTLAVIAMYNAVFHWNSWFDASIYVTKESLKPVQSILVGIINSTKFSEAIANSGAGAGQLNAMKVINVRSVTTATMIVTIIPIVMIYPFFQRYFIQGIMIGSVKG